MAGKQIVVVGAGGHGRVVCEAIAAEGSYRLLGFLDDFLTVGANVGATQVLGPLTDLPRLVLEQQLTHCVVAAGDNAVRRTIVAKITEMSPRLFWGTVIHPTAQLSPSAVVGAGSVLLAGSIVSTGVRIGRHCIVNTGSQLDHDSRLADYTSLAPGAVTGGNVVTGEAVAVGLGARVIHGITIGEESVVGAGAVVVRDVPALVVTLGVPSRVVSSRQPGDQYL